MRRAIKHVVQKAAASIGPLTWRLGGKPRLVILMYHRILPLDHPARATEQPGMYVAPQTLAMHLEVLSQHFTLIHLDDWTQRRTRGQPLPRAACAITFDDGWRDNYEYAWPVLQRAGAPATIYVVSDLIGTRYSFWPTMLADILAGCARPNELLPSWLRDLAAASHVQLSGPMNPGAIDELIAACKRRYSDTELQQLVSDLGNGGGRRENRDLMDWDEIRAMMRDDLVRIGSHTRRHTRLLQGLTEAEVEDEIDGSARIIEQQLGRRPATFCYPNGDYSRLAVDSVRQRYAAAVTTQRGWNSPASDFHLLQRIGVHDDVSSNRTQLLARLGGIG